MNIELFLFSNESVTTLTNYINVETIPIQMSASAPETDSSDSNYDTVPATRKKHNPDEIRLKDEVSHVKECIKERCQKTREKDLDEASNCSSLSRVKAISPVAALTSVNVYTFVIFGYFHD